MQQRNFHLIQAWSLMAETSPWKRSVALADEINRFQGRGVWRRWRYRDEPPPGSSQLRTHLFHAMKTGFYIPGTVGGLHNICTK